MECGNCTLCCKVLNIKETNSLPGKLCKYCEENVGCKIYEDRPESCKIFECAWKQMDNTHIDLRPNNCGVLFEKWTDKVIVGGTDRKSLSGLVMNQIKYFKNEGISVLIINHIEKTRTFYYAPGHDREFIRKEINGSTKLYK